MGTILIQIRSSWNCNQNITLTDSDCFGLPEQFKLFLLDRNKNETIPGISGLFKQRNLNTNNGYEQKCPIR